MGRRQKISREQRRILTGLLVAACLAIGALAVGISVLSDDSQPVRGAGVPELGVTPELADGSQIEAQARAAGLAARNAAEKAAAEEAAAQEAAAEAAREEAAQQARAEQRAADRASARASAPAAPTDIPTDTTMYLSVPAIGLYDIPVLEGTTEASLSAGAGHLSTTGYPWVPGSNTYIAGHRLGYPGTMSDHVFWDLPSLAVGDEVIVTDSLGQSYTYAVSEVLEVPITELSVTAPVGRDVVSLQTCIEDFGDYWTAGPNWNVRYVVRADRVS